MTFPNATQQEPICSVVSAPAHEHAREVRRSNGLSPRRMGEHGETGSEILNTRLLNTVWSAALRSLPDAMPWHALSRTEHNACTLAFTPTGTRDCQPPFPNVPCHFDPYLWIAPPLGATLTAMRDLIYRLPRIQRMHAVHRVVQGVSSLDPLHTITTRK
jgi:hypothetical protein